VRAVRVDAKPPVTILFIFRIISVKPDDVALPFTCKDMRGDAVKEPAVV
jgi:hypothetical protein